MPVASPAHTPARTPSTISNNQRPSSVSHAPLCIERWGGFLKPGPGNLVICRVVLGAWRLNEGHESAGNACQSCPHPRHRLQAPWATTNGPRLSATHHSASKGGAVFSNLGLEMSSSAAWVWVCGARMKGMRALGMLASPAHTPGTDSKHHQQQPTGLLCQPHTTRHRKVGRFSPTWASKSRYLRRGFGCEMRA